MAIQPVCQVLSAEGASFNGGLLIRERLPAVSTRPMRTNNRKIAVERPVTHGVAEGLVADETLVGYMFVPEAVFELPYQLVQDFIECEYVASHCWFVHTI